MLTESIISGSLGQALYRDDKGVWILERENPEPRFADPSDVSMFRHTAREVALADPAGLPVSADTLRSRLQEEVDFFTGLDGLLVGMDADFSDAARRAAIRSAERILSSDEALANRIRVRFLIPANSQEWDPAGALLLAQTFAARAAAAAYQPLADGTVDIICDSLNDLARSHFGSGIEAQSHREALIRSGLVTELCAAFGNRSALLNLPFRVSKLPQFKAVDPGGKILAGIVARLAGKAPRDEPITRDLHSVESGEDNKSADPLAMAVLDAAEFYSGPKGKGAVSRTNEISSVQREVLWISERLEKGEVDKAEFALIQLIKSQTRSSKLTDLVKTLTSVADRARRLKHFEFSLRILNLVRFVEVGDPFVVGVYAEVLREIGSADDACILLDQAVQDFPSNVVLVTAYADTLRELGRFEEALSIFRKAMRDFPDDEIVPSAYAETLRDAGCLNEAYDLFQQTMARFPNKEAAYNACAETLRDMGRLSDALAMYRQNMDRFPDSEIAPTAYGETLRDLGRSDEALVTFRKTIERFPDNPVAPSAYAETLRELGRLEEARVAFAEAMDRFPNNYVFPTALAETLREMNRPEDALSVYGRAYSRFPNDAWLRNAYANLLMIVGRYEEAERLIEGAISRLAVKDDWIALHIKGMAYFRRGKLKEALEIFEMGSQSVPFPRAKHYFATAYSVALLADRRSKEALRVLDEIDRESGAQTFNRTNVLLFRAHAVGENGNGSSARNSIYGLLKEKTYLTKGQTELSQLILERYVERGHPLDSASMQAINDNIYRVELELINPISDLDGNTLRRVA